MNMIFLLNDSQVTVEEVWVIGQALGAPFEGDEQELLLQIEGMEVRDRDVWEKKNRDTE
ncbi:hypothetical protein Ancab_009836, partial [Ancistrocladus abbreviatus]